MCVGRLLFRVYLLCIMLNLSHSESNISQKCLPCNSTISLDSPHIGFLCNEGFPSRPLQTPYSCNYIVKHTKNYNYTLQFFLHEMYFRNNSMEISLCPENYKILMENIPGLRRDTICNISTWKDVVFTTYITSGWFLNISIIRPNDFHLRLPTDHYGERYGYNITYEIKPNILDPHKGNRVDHAGRSHLSNCNKNGIPVLKPHPFKSSINNATQYAFICDCLAQGTHGEFCQYDDKCTRETERSVCSNHGNCKIIASMLKCECDKDTGHIGPHCKFPHTAQPPDTSQTEDCNCTASNSYCHILIMNGKKEGRCSCRAGYQLGENSTCDQIHKYDIVANISEKCLKTKNTKDYIHEVEQLIKSTSTTVKNLKHIPMDKDNASDHQLNSGIFQVQFETDRYNLSLLEDLDKCMNFSSTPHLSLGPISLDEKRTKLTCEAYGGDEMLFTWLKDDIKIFTTNVRNCSVVNKIVIPHLGMEARVGRKGNLAKHTCLMQLIIDNWNVTNQGKYTFRVTDRHHIQESHLIMNCSSNLDIVMTPLLATVRYGSDLKVNCRTTKYWDSEEQYIIEWNHPKHVSGYEKETILYHGSNVTIRNITDDTEVICTITEPFPVRKWCPGIGSQKSFGNKSIHIRVLKSEDISNKRYCPGESAYNITWQDTPVNNYDVQLCPKGFSGKSFRDCVVSSTAKIDWMLPDFSNCKFDQLGEVFRTLTLQHSLGLHGPEASLVDTDTQKLTMQILDIMKNRTEPILPGESTHILQLLRSVIHANQNSLNKVTPEVFFGVINLVVGQEKKFDTRKLETISALIKDFQITTDSPENNITLTSLSAFAQYLHSNIFAFNTTSESSWWVTTELNTLQLETSHRATTQIESQNKILAQVVVFTEPQRIFSHRSLSCDGNSEIAELRAPLVHLTVMTVDNATTSNAQEKIREAETPMWTLHYPCNNNMDILKENTSQQSWRWQCGRTNFSYQPARWDLSENVCSPVQLGSGVSCSCSCYGQGLYGLLQVSFEPPPTPIHEMKKLLGVCLSISSGILLLCGAILLPRCYIQAVQLKLLKCLTLAAFDAAFVLYAFYPIPKLNYVWVLILCIWCQILSLGIGVAQMMDIFIKLSNMSRQLDSNSGVNIAPMTVMLQNLPVSPTTMILIIALFMATMCSGIVYLICLVTGYQLTRPFLPVEDAPGLTGAVLGFMITITVLWGYLCVSNLTLMRMKYSTPQHSSGQIVRSLVSLMLGDWVFIIMSLFEDFNLTLNSLFCITSLALSIMIIWIYVFTADDTTCCFGKDHKNPNTGDITVVAGGVEYGGHSSVGGEDLRSCMSGLMGACHSSNNTNRSSYVGTESTSDDYRNRGDSMLSQLSASATITECHEANPSHGGPRTNIHISRRNPKDMLPQHPNLQMYSLSEKRNTNNILLRGGVDFVCGEDDSDIAKMTRKRTISFTHTQPIIHEDTPRMGYLQMQPNDCKEMSVMSHKPHFIEPPVTFSNCSRSYVNVPTSNSCQKAEKLQTDINNEKSFLKPQKYNKKGYLPMTVKDKNDFTTDQKGLNEINTNLKCNSFTVELNKDSESDEESLKAEMINASSTISESEFEDITKNLQYINASTPRKENRVISNENDQVIVMHKNNVKSQDYVNSPKNVTKIFVNANEDDHNSSSVITSKNYVNNKSSLEMTPPRSLSPNDTLDSVNGDAFSETSVHSSPRMIRKHNTKRPNNGDPMSEVAMSLEKERQKSNTRNITSSDGSKT